MKAVLLFILVALFGYINALYRLQSIQGSGSGQQIINDFAVIQHEQLYTFNVQDESFQTVTSGTLHLDSVIVGDSDPLSQTTLQIISLDTNGNSVTCGGYATSCDIPIRSDGTVYIFVTRKYYQYIPPELPVSPPQGSTVYMRPRANQVVADNIGPNQELISLTLIPCFSVSGGGSLAAYPGASIARPVTINLLQRTYYTYGSNGDCENINTYRAILSPNDGNCVWASTGTNNAVFSFDNTVDQTSSNIQVNCASSPSHDIPPTQTYSVSFGPVDPNAIGDIGFGPRSRASDWFATPNANLNNYIFNGYTVSYADGLALATSRSVFVDDPSRNFLEFSIGRNGNPAPYIAYEVSTASIDPFSFDPVTAGPTFVQAGSTNTSWKGVTDGQGIARVYYKGPAYTATTGDSILTNAGAYAVQGNPIGRAALGYRYVTQYTSPNTRNLVWPLEPHRYTTTVQILDTTTNALITGQTLQISIDKPFESVWFFSNPDSSTQTVVMSGTNAVIDLYSYQAKNTFISGTYVVTARIMSGAYQGAFVQLYVITCKGPSIGPTADRPYQVEYTAQTKGFINVAPQSVTAFNVRFLDANGNIPNFATDGSGGNIILGIKDSTPSIPVGFFDGNQDPGEYLLSKTISVNTVTGMGSFNLFADVQTVPDPQFIITGTVGTFGLASANTTQNPFLFGTISSGTAKYTAQTYDVEYGFTDKSITVGSDSTPVNLKFRLKQGGSFVVGPRLFATLYRTTEMVRFAGTGLYSGSDYTQGQFTRSLIPDACGVYTLPIQGASILNGFSFPSYKVFLHSAYVSGSLYDVTVNSAPTATKVANSFRSQSGTIAGLQYGTISGELGSTKLLTGYVLDRYENSVTDFCYVGTFQAGNTYALDGVSKTVLVSTDSNGDYSFFAKVVDSTTYAASTDLNVGSLKIYQVNTPKRTFNYISGSITNDPYNKQHIYFTDKTSTIYKPLLVKSPTGNVVARAYTLSITPTDGKVLFDDNTTTKTFTTDSSGVMNITLKRIGAFDPAEAHSVVTTDQTLPNPVYTITSTTSVPYTYIGCYRTIVIDQNYQNTGNSEECVIIVSRDNYPVHRVATYYNSGGQPGNKLNCYNNVTTVEVDEPAGCSPDASGDKVGTYYMGGPYFAMYEYTPATTTAGPTTTPAPTTTPPPTTTAPTTTSAPTTTPPPTSTATPAPTTTPPPTTSAPTTATPIPTTAAPTTAGPVTTASPTTQAPVTTATPAPVTTQAATTAGPVTTGAPTTAAPATTASPTTTSAPTGTPTPTPATPHSSAVANGLFALLALPILLIIAMILHLEPGRQ